VKSYYKHKTTCEAQF